jgi:hypothetical protein
LLTTRAEIVALIAHFRSRQCEVLRKANDTPWVRWKRALRNMGLEAIDANQHPDPD